MPKFCANLTMLYNEHDFLDRFDAAARAGFRGVEYLFPYAFPKDAIAERLVKNRLTQVLHNLPAGDWAAGERGIACIPGREREFQDGVGTAIEYASALGCRQLNCLVGVPPAGVSRDQAHETTVANLRFAASKLAGAGIRLLIEPVNTRDIPGFFLCHTKQALGIIETKQRFVAVGVFEAPHVWCCCVARVTRRRVSARARTWEIGAVSSGSSANMAFPRESMGIDCFTWNIRTKRQNVKLALLGKN